MLLDHLAREAAAQRNRYATRPTGGPKSTSRSHRPPWEYAGGPNVGEDVPIAGEPREEITPGVPAEAEQSEPEEHSDEIEVREVRAADPELSTETNERLG